MRKRYAAAALAAVVAAGAGAWWWQHRAPGAATSSESGPPPAVAVTTGVVERAPARERFATVGVVHARAEVHLSTEVAGVVAAVEVVDNAAVEAGQIIVRLEQNDERAAVEAAEADLAEARAALDRARTLRDRDFAAEARVETARARVANAEAALEQARVRLDNRSITAPIDGRVGLVHVSPGTYLTPGTSIASIYSVDDLELRFDVPQRIANRIAPGAELRVGDHVLALSSLTPAASGTTRTFTGVARLPQPPPAALRPGVFVDVELTVETRKDALFVDEAAILRSGERAFLFRVQDGVAERIEVETGVRQAGRIEVRGPLAAGDRIVTTGVQKIDDGTAVRSGDGG